MRAVGDVAVEVDGAVAVLTLDRPEQLNTFTGAMGVELEAAYRRCDEDDAIRAVVLTGAVIGLAAAAIGGRLIEKMLFGVRPLDVTTFTVVAIVLLATAAIAIAGPAWRATRIDPAKALRAQ